MTLAGPGRLSGLSGETRSCRSHSSAALSRCSRVVLIRVMVKHVDDAVELHFSSAEGFDRLSNDSTLGDPPGTRHSPDPGVDLSRDDYVLPDQDDPVLRHPGCSVSGALEKHLTIRTAVSTLVRSIFSVWLINTSPSSSRSQGVQESLRLPGWKLKRSA